MYNYYSHACVKCQGFDGREHLLAKSHLLGSFVMADGLVAVAVHQATNDVSFGGIELMQLLSRICGEVHKLVFPDHS